MKGRGKMKGEKKRFRLVMMTCLTLALVVSANLFSGCLPGCDSSSGPEGSLEVTPSDGLSSLGMEGGPFEPSTKSYTLQNTGSRSISWMASNDETWVTLSSTDGALMAGASVTVTVSINGDAEGLAFGDYSDSVVFANTTDGEGDTTRSVNLTVDPYREPPPDPGGNPPRP